MNQPIVLPSLCAALLASLTPAAWALDYQVHGFLTQGGVYSTGNELFGHSTTGSAAYFEAGLNGTVSLGPNLLVSGQVFARDAGATDNAKPRLDFGLVDYRPVNDADSSLGVRLGRVKNPYGLFNETRDSVFTRPGILLPQSVYFDGEGIRELLFSSDGGQLYGSQRFGEHDVSVVGGGAFQRRLSKDEQREFGLVLPGDLSLDDFWYGRLFDEYREGRWRGGVTYARADLRFLPDHGVPLDARSAIDLYILSLRYNAEHFALTGEYLRDDTDTRSNFLPGGKSSGDGFYAQGEWFIDPHWTLLTRYDGTFTDRNDRDGRHYAKQTPPPGAPAPVRTSRFAHDLMLGGHWLYDQHWGVWAESHWIYGTATVSPADNIGRTPDAHWALFLLMGGYRF